MAKNEADEFEDEELLQNKLHLLHRLRFTYFPLFAKGPACALALEHSGIEWEGALTQVTSILANSYASPSTVI